MLCIYMGKHSSKSVIACYDFDGKLVKVYNTAKQASEELGLFHRSVDKAIRMNTTIKGYQWRRYKCNDDVETSIDPYHKHSISTDNVKVVKCDKDGNVLDTYFSIRLAAKENDISPKQIRECLNGHQHKAGGYYWKKID